MMPRAFSPVQVLWRCLAVLLLLCLQACATVPPGTPPNAHDPIEPFNRAMFGFNDALDGAVLKPVASAYQTVTPQFVRKGISNFFNNLQDVWSTVNSGLQGRGQDFSDNMGRVMVNSTLGLFGLIDVASGLNIDRHTSGFGLTLGRWGVPAGPYVVLPLLGPSTLREVAALPVDYSADLSYQLGGNADANAATAVVKIVDARAKLLNAGNLVDDAALDKYSFMRDGYLQRQRNVQYDGNPPEEE